MKSHHFTPTFAILASFSVVLSHLSAHSEIPKVLASNAPQLEAPEGMVYIPAGTFNMGDHWKVVGDHWNYEDELPVHEVYVSGFYMDQYEVTQDLLDDVHDWAVQNGYGFERLGYGDGPDHPIGRVYWYDAVKWANAKSEKEGRRPVYYNDAELMEPYRQGRADFTNWGSVDWNANGYRLPTEAEWEKGARGGLDGHQYPWNSFGEDYEKFIDSDKANYTMDIRGSVPVGSYPPNGYGLFNMAGNVSELCWDWKENYYYATPSATEDNPKGPLSGTYRIVRGGNFASSALRTRVAFRGWRNPLEFPSDIGFRLVSVSSVMPVLPTQYMAWTEEMFGAEHGNADVSAPNADADQDGWLNWVEYAFGSLPNNDDSEPDTRLVPVRGENDQAWSLTFQRRSNLEGFVRLQLEVTESLKDPEWAASEAPETVINLAGSLEQVIVEIGTRSEIEYFRLRAER